MVYELRTYVPVAGKEAALHRRFADHALAIFTRCGVENVGYWTDPNGTLVYLVRFPDEKAQNDAWAKFKTDPAWKQIKAESEKDGPLTVSVTGVTLTPTPYSPGLK